MNIDYRWEVRSNKFATVGKVKGLRKPGGELTEVMVKWGDAQNFSWEKVNNPNLTFSPPKEEEAPVA